MKKVIFFLLVATTVAFGATRTVYKPAPFEVVNTPLYCDEGGVVKEYAVGEIVDGTKAVNDCSKNIATVEAKAAKTKAELETKANAEAAANKEEEDETKQEEFRTVFFLILLAILVIAAIAIGMKTEKKSKVKVKDNIEVVFFLLGVMYLCLTYFATWKIVLIGIAAVVVLPSLYAAASSPKEEV